MNTILPDARKNKVDGQIKAIATGPNAEFLKEFGVKIETQSNDVLCKKRQSPIIDLGRIQAKMDHVFFFYFKKYIFV